MNLRPSGYEPDELPPAPPRDVSFILSIKDFFVGLEPTTSRTGELPTAPPRDVSFRFSFKRDANVLKITHKTKKSEKTQDKTPINHDFFLLDNPMLYSALFT